MKSNKATTTQPIHYWSDSATVPAPGTLAPHAVCTTNPTPTSRFTSAREAVTCKHCLRMLRDADARKERMAGDVAEDYPGQRISGPADDVKGGR